MTSHTPTHRTTNTFAIISLVSGILGWSLLPFLGSISAVICGHMARARIRRSNGSEEGDGLAIAGLILGWASIGLWLAVVVFLLFFGGLAVLAATNA